MKKILKYTLFSFLPLLIIILGAELFFRWSYFSKKEKRNFACAYQFELWKTKAQRFQEKMVRKKEEERLKQANEEIAKLVGADLSADRNAREKCVQGLYTPEGKFLLEKFRSKYEAAFQEFSDEVKRSGAVLWVTYFPSGRPKIESDECRKFFGSLSKNRGIPFYDMTELLGKYPQNYYLLSPLNAHLSRFGNLLIAEEFSRILKNQEIVIPINVPHNNSQLLGDYSPNVSEVMEPQADLVYRHTVNSQGLRTDQDLKFPKLKPRILCIGDSFTYGPYLPSAFTYPGFLKHAMQELEIVNAGVTGYHIEDELAYYKERGKFAQADIVILQVLDNDIPGQFFFYQNLFSRSKKKFLPSSEEIEFFKKMKKKKAK